eukprot:7582396-Pyramimonas_sp.AAC.1
MVACHRCPKLGLSIANHHCDVFNASASPSNGIVDTATQRLVPAQPDDEFPGHEEAALRARPNTIIVYYDSIIVMLHVLYKCTASQPSCIPQRYCSRL